MKTNVLFLLVPLIVGSSACRKDETTAVRVDEAVLYANSFEQPSDTVGWEGLIPQSFQRDVPPGSGVQSAGIAGGCIIPHARMRLVVRRDGPVFLRCWGKAVVASGTVALVMPGSADQRVDIEEQVWKQYRTPGAIACLAGDTLEIWMSSGGIVPGGILVDNLEVVRAQ